MGRRARQSGLTRRQALGRVGAVAAGALAGSTAIHAQGDGAAEPVRLVPRVDLVNVLEYEEQASLALEPAVFARIAGSDRAPFEKVTLRPRMLVPTRDLDLGITLFGRAHAAPILVGPIRGPEAFHREADAAVVEGASAAHAAVVLAGPSGESLARLVAAASTPVWFQVFASDASAGAAIEGAVAAGCEAIVMTIGAEPASGGVRATRTSARHWSAVRAAASTAGLPVIVKGIDDPTSAQLALENGAGGIVFSSYGALPGRAGRASVLELPGIVEAVGGRAPVLVDGSFRRGTDILKALAFGAAAVLVARPVMWGLAAYGADGVQGVMEMLQTELARYMAMCGQPAVRTLDRAVVRVHAG